MGNRLSSRLKPDVLSDLLQQTEYTEDELQQFYQEFKKECPRGRLTRRHLQRMYPSCQSFPNGDATMFTDHILRTFDLNHDGVVDFREFMCGMNTLMKGSLDDKLGWLFRLFDVNDDGFISRSEMVDILQAVDLMMGVGTRMGTDSPDGPGRAGDSPESKMIQIFDKADKDGDNRLSRSEFTEAAIYDTQITGIFQRSGNPD